MKLLSTTVVFFLLSTSPTFASCGATAAGINNNNVKVAASRNYNSCDDAKAHAIYSCEDNEVPDCRIVTVFGTGQCRYITTGKNEQTNYVGWGEGRTYEEALGACTSQGLSCHTEVTGGCND